MQTLSLSITPAQTAAWRKQIFQQLTERTKRELENFRHYEQAVEQVSGAGAPFLSRRLLVECLLHASPEARQGGGWVRASASSRLGREAAPPGPHRAQSAEIRRSSIHPP